MFLVSHVLSIQGREWQYFGFHTWTGNFELKTKDYKGNNNEQFLVRDNQ